MVYVAAIQGMHILLFRGGASTFQFCSAPSTILAPHQVSTQTAIRRYIIILMRRPFELESP